MIVRFKILGAAVLAAFAMSAALASSAQATNFTAFVYPTSLSASSALGNDDLKTEAGSVECSSFYESSSISEATSTLTVNPTYTSCKAFGFLSAKFETGPCRYILHTDGSVDFKCTILTSGGFYIESPAIITAATCEMEIGSQWGLSKFDLANSSAKISVQATVTGIKYKVTKDGFGCPFSGTGSKTGATFTQNNSMLFWSSNGSAIDIG